jgi:hypothetical protein
MDTTLHTKGGGLDTSAGHSPQQTTTTTTTTSGASGGKQKRTNPAKRKGGNKTSQAALNRAVLDLASQAAAAGDNRRAADHEASKKPDPTPAQLYRAEMENIRAEREYSSLVNSLTPTTDNGLVVTTPPPSSILYKRLLVPYVMHDLTQLIHVLDFKVEYLSSKWFQRFFSDSVIDKLFNSRVCVTGASLCYAPIQIIHPNDSRPHSDKSDASRRDCTVTVYQPVIIVKDSNNYTTVAYRDIKMSEGRGWIWDDTPFELLKNRTPIIDLPVEWVEKDSLYHTTARGLGIDLDSSHDGCFLFKLQYISTFALSEFRSRRMQITPGLKPEICAQRLVRAYSEDATTDPFLELKLRQGVDVVLDTIRMLVFMMTRDPITPVSHF